MPKTTLSSRRLITFSFPVGFFVAFLSWFAFSPLTPVSVILPLYLALLLTLLISCRAIKSDLALTTEQIGAFFNHIVIIPTDAQYHSAYRNFQHHRALGYLGMSYNPSIALTQRLRRSDSVQNLLVADRPLYCRTRLRQMGSPQMVKLCSLDHRAVSLTKPSS